MQFYRLAVEIEPDDCGWHFVLIDAEDDSIIRVGLSHATYDAAERDAEDYLDRLENHGGACPPALAADAHNGPSRVSPLTDN